MGRIGGIIIGMIACASLALAQTRPASQPMVAGTLPPGWQEIDQRLVFFTVQLAGVETSLSAVNKALKTAGYHQSTKQAQAEQMRKGNELMDRNAGGPVSWKEFYGKTAERFFYRPDFEITVTKLKDVKKSSPDDLSQQNLPGPASQRPPQFDYIYRANQDAEKRADAEIAQLGGKIDALVERRRQLETEQASIWAKIAFQAVASRKLGTKPIYRFDLKIDGADELAKQRQDAARAGALFVRTVLRAIADAEDVVANDPAATFDALQPVVADANAKLNDQIVHAPKLALDMSDPSTSLGKLVASADRLADVTKNVRDCYHGAIDADRAGDDSQKQSLRAFMQQAVFDCATNVSTSAEFVSVISREWKAEVDVEHPVPTTGPSPVSLVTRAEAPAKSSTEPHAETDTPSPAAPAKIDPKYAAIVKDMKSLDRWTITHGKWKMTADGKLRGEGDTAIDFDVPIPHNSRISFHMTVVDGMRPRIYFGGANFYLGNEGYSKELSVRGGGAKDLGGSAVPYRNGQEMACSIAITDDTFSVQIDDHVIQGKCDKSDAITLVFCAGDGWSQGIVDYSDFDVAPVHVTSDASSSQTEPVRPSIERGWTIMFRSKDPLVWNIHVQNKDSYAVPMSSAPEHFRYVRMRRMDTKDEVILAQDTFEAPHWPMEHRWFRGDKPMDKQACALGIIDMRNHVDRNHAPVVDVRPDGDAGGWGFGIWEAGPEHQGYIWDNKSIDPTVIEIAVTDRELNSSEKRHLVAP